MDVKLFMTVFATVFVAELGDKTQLATLLYAADARESKTTVFLASAMALVVSAAVAVIFGAALTQVISPKVLRWISGLGFIGIGIWFLWAGGD